MTLLAMSLGALPAVDAARRLLGSELVRTIDGSDVRVRIVETEAYDETDAASHSYAGRTQRTEVMFGPAGHLYVYFTYGMHYCCNVVTGPEGTGAAVLIRAVEPVEGEERMQQYRPKSGYDLTNGPAKLCQALDVTKVLNGHDLERSPLRLTLNEPVVRTDVVQTTRIGISKAAEQPWRFYLKNNGYVSRP